MINKTADELMDSSWPIEYANFRTDLYHVVIIWGKTYPKDEPPIKWGITACGKRLQPHQISTDYSGRICKKCAASRDWFAQDCSGQAQVNNGTGES